MPIKTKEVTEKNTIKNIDQLYRVCDFKKVNIRKLIKLSDQFLNLKGLNNTDLAAQVSVRQLKRFILSLIEGQNEKYSFQTFIFISFSVTKMDKEEIEMSSEFVPVWNQIKRYISVAWKN